MPAGPEATVRVETTRTADGISIAWSGTGNGPPLVLLPSAPLGNFTAEWQVPEHRGAYEALARNFRLIQYDARGTGRSQRSVPPLVFEHALLDLDAVLVAANTPRVVLLGMYLSSTTALEYALRQPERVSHLVLFGGGARGWDGMGSQQSQALLSLVNQDWDTFVGSAMHAWLGSDHSETVALQTEVAREASTPELTRQMLEAFSAVDQTDRLPGLQPPLLVFHRRSGRQIPLEVSRRLVSGVPNGRLVVLDGSTASILTRDFDVVLQHLLAFTGTSEADASEVAAPARGPRTRDLSPRELDVLRLIAGGETNAEIGRRLGVSVNTVERHVANLYRKIDARGRADATAWAIRHGVVE